MEIEICIDSLEQAAAAKKFSATRVELCSALDIGGLTPTIGLTGQCVGLGNIEVHVMIRPRSGGFCYSRDEVQTMKLDIQQLQMAGARGVVFGILNKDHSLNIEDNYQLFTFAKSLGMEVTFHRAFDFMRDPMESLDQLIDIGFDRILTSGQQPTAIEGIKMIRKMVAIARGRIQIMAGSGVNKSNVKELQNTGIDAVHFTARKLIKGITTLEMGNEYELDNEKLRSVLESINLN